jgi:hypothetical protein
VLGSALRVALEADEEYRRLMAQVESCMERRKQLLALVEDDPDNGNVRQLLSDLENVLAFKKRRLRALVAAKEEELRQARA